MKKPRGYWTKELVFAEGLKYPNRRTWQLSQSRSYNIAWQNDWLDEIIGREIIHGTWTKEAVIASGKKYPTKTAWRNSKEGSAYVIAKRNDWLKELTHFEKELSFGERTIYKWLLTRDVIFESEKTFPGLRNKYPLRYDFWVPSHNLLIEYQGRQHELGWSGNFDDALQIKDRDQMKIHFAQEMGYKLLHIESINEQEIGLILQAYLGRLDVRGLTKKEAAQIKHLGGWTKERALLDAKNYKTRNEWDKASHGYNYARINRFLDEACAHMKRVNAWTSAREKLWTKEAVMGDANKYRRPGEWKKASPSAYAISLRNNWHQEATSHMVKRTHTKNKTVS